MALFSTNSEVCAAMRSILDKGQPYAAGNAIPKGKILVAFQTSQGLSVRIDREAINVDQASSRRARLYGHDDRISWTKRLYTRAQVSALRRACT